MLNHFHRQIMGFHSLRKLTLVFDSGKQTVECGTLPRSLEEELTEELVVGTACVDSPDVRVLVAVFSIC